MIRVALVHTVKDYQGIRPPFGPGKQHPELTRLGGGSSSEPPNPVYAAVRQALAALGLDAEAFGSEAWNPLGALVDRGQRVVLKPNFIRHWNPSAEGTLESVVTHASILRAIADYALLAVGPDGSVVIAEAPQQDCSFATLARRIGLPELQAFYAEQLGRELGVIDLRREEVSTRDGVIVERRPLPGDPAGYRVVDLGARSFFQGAGLDPQRFRGADYDPAPTSEHHRDGRNEYLLSETVLSADLVVNLPKLKTHKKTGTTLALQNLVGINGDKNWLPHHCVGPVAEGGDEYPGQRPLDRWRTRGAEHAKRWLRRGRGIGMVRLLRRLEFRVRGDGFIRAGNWHGNRTTWRMALDLNRCLYYSGVDGLQLDAPAPVRTVLTLLDGIVAGEGEGPLAPRDRPLGALVASTDPVAVDLVALRLMGFDEERIPKIREAMLDPGPRITSVRKTSDVEVALVQGESCRTVALDAVPCERPFEPHPGWKGHIERKAS
ncbi:MAG: DUF362 domain-containing protein [Myxococcota bacterium]